MSNILHSTNLKNTANVKQKTANNINKEVIIRRLFSLAPSLPLCSD